MSEWLASLNPLLDISSVFPHCQLDLQVTRNQLHRFTKDTSLNVKKLDN